MCSLFVMELTRRDNSLLAYLCFAREAGVELLGSIFFAINPQRGTANKRPAHAALERLCALRDAGFVVLRAGRVRATARAATHIGSSPGSEMGQRLRAHHDGTLAAIEHHRARLPLGTVIVETRLEGKERGRRMGRRGVTKKQLGSIPDATITLRDASGRTTTVALEFVTKSYTKAMIKEKHEAFRAAYDELVMYADNQKTAHRVMSVTGHPCFCA